jgi:cytochrome c2
MRGILMSRISVGRAASDLPWLLWHLCVAVAVTAICVQLSEGVRLLATPAARQPFFFGFFFAHMAVAVAVWDRTRVGRRVDPAELLFALAAGLGGWALWLLVAKAEVPRLLMVLLCACSVTSVAVSLPLRGRILLGATAALAAVALGGQLMGDWPRNAAIALLDLGPKPSRSEVVIDTSQHLVGVTFFDRYFDVCDHYRQTCETPRTGGAIEAFADGFLYATGEGRLHFVKDRPTDSLRAHRLAVDVPINSDAFVAGGANERDLSVFRVMDILVREVDGRFELYASHHHWDVEGKCFTMRVSRLVGSTAELLDGADAGQWETVWDARPCLPLLMSKGGQKQFGGDGAGGRMLFADGNTLLVTIGDQQWDGWNWEHAVSQDPASNYGKVIRIDLATGASSVFASGLRNPEGFVRDADGRLWSTEHGPQGGDELNLIVEGGNYGWPLMTYGREYGTGHWPLLVPGAEDDPGLRKPVFAWVPSIGVSNLLQVKGARFDRWKGDFLILSFTKSLQRAHVREDRVVVMEPIVLRPRNGRLRDIVETADGRLVVLLDLGALAFLEPLDREARTPRALAARGGILFGACLQCHRHTDGADHSIGPDLFGVVGRPVGGAAGYAYSKALGTRGGVWNRDTLDAFLENPAAFAPGTAMQNVGLADEGDRAAVIAYLERMGKK